VSIRRKPSRPKAAEQSAGLVSLGLAVKRLRRETGLTQAALAYRSGVSIRGLRKLEHGKVEAHWGTLRRIAEGLDVPLADLLRAAEEAESDQAR
jgi:transcriptional regulator with XRE-family HTH domain